MNKIKKDLRNTKEIMMKQRVTERENKIRKNQRRTERKKQGRNKDKKKKKK